MLSSAGFILLAVIFSSRPHSLSFAAVLHLAQPNTINPAVAGLFSVGASLTPTQPPLPTPTSIPFTVNIIDSPTTLVQGDTATFTWTVNGPTTQIHTTTIYYSHTSMPGSLTTAADPEQTGYTNVINDFIQGDYTIPLRFVANVKNMTPGTYFFRGYAAIGTKHIWTEEQSFVVQSIPRHTISIIDYPKTLSSGTAGSFTWDIVGPNAETGYTAIVAGKVSKPGPLDTDTTTTMTPYTTIVQDFTHNTAAIPLRFVGNATLSDPGTYFFRGVAYINGKNIWSEEYSFIVQ